MRPSSEATRGLRNLAESPCRAGRPGPRSYVNVCVGGQRVYLRISRRNTRLGALGRQCHRLNPGYFLPTWSSAIGVRCR
jgi:hypothetical protein